MSELTSLLCTFEPKKLEYELDLLKDVNPISWAYNLCHSRAKSGALTLQAMKSAFGNYKQGEPDEALYFDTNDPNAVEGILKGIASGYAGHARFEMIYADSVGGFCWYEPVSKFYGDHFIKTMESLYPLGHCIQSTLWFSASKHVYEAHTDPIDGFLFQLEGKKRVKVWGMADEFRDPAIYNTDHIYRQTMPYEEFELNAGDVLFIPGGAVHEVTVFEGISSVSMSFHMGGCYPLMILCEELAELNEGHSFTVKEEHSKTGKPYITQVNTTYAMADRTSDEITPELCDELCAVIQTDVSEEQLREFLIEWWRVKRAKPSYKGPYILKDQKDKNRFR